MRSRYVKVESSTREGLDSGGRKKTDQTDRWIDRYASHLHLICIWSTERIHWFMLYTTWNCTRSSGVEVSDDVNWTGLDWIELVLLGLI